MSLGSFMLKCKKPDEDVYEFDVRMGMRFTRQLIVNRKNLSTLKRIVVMELLSMSYRFNKEIDRRIREVLEDEENLG